MSMGESQIGGSFVDRGQWEVEAAPHETSPVIARVSVTRKGGGVTATGTVKWDGCIDIGFDDGMLHLCGPDDPADLFGAIYDAAKGILGDRADWS